MKVWLIFKQYLRFLDSSSLSEVACVVLSENLTNLSFGVKSVLFYISECALCPEPLSVSLLMFTCVGPERFHETSWRGDICRRTSPQSQRRVRRLSQCGLSTYIYNLRRSTIQMTEEEAHVVSRRLQQGC